MRIAVVLYVLFHLSYDWWGQNTVRWDVAYNAALYFFISFVCYKSIIRRKATDYFLGWTSLLFAWYGVIELSCYNYSMSEYVDISNQSYSYRDFGILLIIGIIVITWNTWVQKNERRT